MDRIAASKYMGTHQGAMDGRAVDAVDNSSCHLVAKGLHQRRRDLLRVALEHHRQAPPHSAPDGRIRARLAIPLADKVLQPCSDR